MKTIVKRAIRDQKGAGALTLVLALLVVGGLILAPMLGLMSAGLLAGQVYEKKTYELYAADAGVEDAIWRIQSNNLTFVDNCSYPKPLTVNGKNVAVVIYRKDWDPDVCVENLTYEILSTAVTNDDGGGTAAVPTCTAIDAYLAVSYLSLSGLLDNAIVSNDTIDIQPGNYIDGDVWLPDEEDLDLQPGSNITGEVKDNDDMTIYWPTYEQLSTYYLQDVEGAPDPSSSIDLNGGTVTIGPSYRHEGSGDLAVENSKKGHSVLNVSNTVYVTGNLQFDQSGASKNYTLDLNGETIFSEGNIDFPSSVVSVSGPGCIIAKGDITFHPSIGGDDFVFVFSITGEVDFQPAGNFTGCIAGDTHVQLQPNCTINWISPEGKGLNVPWGAGDSDKLPPVTGLRIESWEIE